MGDGLTIVGTTIFHLPNGTFVSRRNTSVQLLTTDGPSPVTHITGAYSGFAAEVRLSGAVNMSEVENGIIVFDCLFMVSPL